MNPAERLSYEQLLKNLLKEEEELQFPRFTNNDALELGIKLVALAQQRVPYKGISVLITRSDMVLFQHSMTGTSSNNENWLRRKKNTVVRLQHSSYYVGRELFMKGELDMEKTYFVSQADYACHGGGFPLLIKGVGCVGAIVVSGLKQEEDHALVTQGIREMIQTINSQLTQQA